MTLPWRWILPGLGGLLAVWAAYSWAYGRGKAHEHARMQPQLDAALWSVKQLSEGIEQQNAGIAAQGKAAAHVAATSAKAVRSGAERRGAVEAMAARVEAVRPSGGQCGAVPGDVAALWERGV